ncbi:glmZ(sRNA)-inactivating NTPase [Lysinibacillus sphaericus]|uniref:RNase adapter RapZ n=1 Tax=Lysinibacillus sphaericus TaxID=1421 RepID=UPI0018CF1A61|nr:RNase adapter RapZ [Lysinibacillus sphaericus]MBG9453167.1 glmZ(sRNA)-inactivating NTPase [Lysinibacillus sphaericus]MBG9477870.1 glmZ(sRNA)-inactivating NTPase [Lysinibacillus sphaericus]MBG9592222.1 glmZ(sRNA)-inactivating NTPase [Lysinibacillus sphaericus]
MTVVVEGLKGKHELVIITGMSGAGKTVAIQSFEDLGYYCIDNLPPALLTTFLTLLRDSGKNITRIAAVMDMRGGDFFDSLIGALDHMLKEGDIVARILFLDADDAALVRRYKETRRAHPLAANGLLLNGIKRERNLLSEVKGRAKFVYNTSNMKPKELREKIAKEFANDANNIFSVNIMSFGFKHGMPIDADLVFDVRFLKNPYYVEELRHKTGLQTEVSSYVLALEDTQTLIQKLTDLFEFMIPLYKQEGKSQLVIAFGCTGGQHRSVTLAEYFGAYLAGKENTVIAHRDINRRKD